MVGLRNAHEARALVESLAWQLTAEERQAVESAVAGW
jgi:hypothetical protein